MVSKKRAHSFKKNQSFSLPSVMEILDYRGMEGRNAMMTDGRKISRAHSRVPLPVKRFHFLFDLEGGVAFGGNFECHADSEDSAWQELEERLPGAGVRVKSVRMTH